jgi:hypothetical protein
MTSRLTSHRFRRRLAWVAVGVALVATIVGGSIWIGDTGRQIDTKLTNEPASVYQAPRAHRLTKDERLALLAASAHFVRTAVARRDLDDAWEMLGPEMRAGQTRVSWRSGNNNVIPFPVRGIAAWSILYSYDNDVAFDLALVGRPGDDIVGKTFTIELKRYPQQGNRWLVASWVPKGITSVGQSKAAAAVPAPPPPTAPLSASWLAVPFALVGLIIAVPLLLVGRSWVKHRRAAKQYERELRGYSSSSSPS